MSEESVPLAGLLAVAASVRGSLTMNMRKGFSIGGTAGRAGIFGVPDLGEG